MQLQWDHRFQPRSTSSTRQEDIRFITALDSSDAVARDLQPTAPAVAFASPQLLSVGGASPRHSTKSPPIMQLVTAVCGNCNAPHGALLNSWTQVTNSYFVQSQSLYRVVGVIAKGKPKPPGGSNAALEGCLIQTLACSTCEAVIGFTCFEAPDDKAPYRGRQFLKLSKIILTSIGTKDRVTPLLETSQIHQVPSTLAAGHSTPEISAARLQSSESRPHSSSNADMDGISEADRAAVKGTNDGSLTWREAHEEWEQKTQVVLSPGAFGKRIVGFKGGRDPKITPQIERLPPPPPPPPPNGILPPKLPGQMNGGHHPVWSHSQATMAPGPPQPQPIESHEQRRDINRDINRIDAAVARLEAMLNGLSDSMAAMRRDLQSRPGTTLNTEDASVLDLLSETVSNVSTKTGEIDGLKVQVETLKRRVKRLEDSGGAAPSTPSHTEAIVPKPVIMQQPQQPQQVQHLQQPQQPYQSPFPALEPNPQPVGWVAVNGTKRASQHQPAGAPEATNKRPRMLDAELIVLDSPGSTPVNYPANNSYGPVNNGDMHALDNWATSSQRPPATRGAHTPARRGPGRPRKYPTPDLGTPAWEQEGWMGEVDADGYYRPLAPNTDDPDRGRIVRRGSLGGPQHTPTGLQHSQIRTRQKPIRNSDGILIRKDGKPDQRSVSSAQNLKRFYAKKQRVLGTHSGDGDGEGDGSVGRDSPDSPFTNDPMAMDMDPDAEGEQRSGSERLQEDSGSYHNSRHEKIMRQMFPNDLAHAATRLDRATAELFEPGKSQTAPQARLQPRAEEIKQEFAVVEAAAQEDEPDAQPTGPTTVVASAEGSKALESPAGTETVNEDSHMNNAEDTSNLRPSTSTNSLAAADADAPTPLDVTPVLPEPAPAALDSGAQQVHEPPPPPAAATATA